MGSTFTFVNLVTFGFLVFHYFLIQVLTLIRGMDSNNGTSIMLTVTYVIICSEQKKEREIR